MELLDESEEKLIKLRPEFALPVKLVDTEFEVEI